MLSAKSKLLKKLIVFFLLLFLTFSIIWVVSIRSQKYDPVETLEVEEATVRVYFSSQLGSPLANWYQGRIPDIEKYRHIEYTLILRNTGPKKKNFVIAEINSDLNSSFTKLIINSSTEAVRPGAILSGHESQEELQYLVEGDPAEIEKLAEQSKIRLIWEEGGKKWEKFVPVNPSEFPNDPDEYYTEDKYGTGETLKIIEGGPTVYVGFSPDPNYPVFDWYKGRQPNSERHRLVAYHVYAVNTGKEKKRFIFMKPILDPSFQKLVINSLSDVPRVLALPDGGVYLPIILSLAEGDPAETEKLAYKTKLRILWTEGGKKYEKIVEVSPSKNDTAN